MSLYQFFRSFYFVVKYHKWASGSYKQLCHAKEVSIMRILRHFSISAILLNEKFV